MNRILLTSLSLLTLGGLYAESAAPTPEQRAERRDKCLTELKNKHPELFKKIDVNGDGDISGPEFGAFLEQREGKFKEKHPELFAAIDSNGDGELGRDEVKAARETRDAKFKANHPKAFEHADKNDDGKIGPQEAHEARDAHRERAGDSK